jgi:exonuclease SbcC
LIRRIILENYMSHARTVIEPAAGLTVLVGPNNCGKSAVVSALQTLCGDNAGDYMVRHGQRTCQVTVETDDGHTITWRRKGAAVSYVIDGREVHRSGRGNLPDDLHEHLRLPKVESSGTGEKFDVHFALQKSPIFLIDNEGRAAAFFSTSSDAERLLEVQKLHKGKVAGAKSSQKDLTAELKRLDEQLTALLPLDGIGERLEEAEASYEVLAAQTREISAWAARLEALAEKGRDVARHRGRCDALYTLSAPPDLADTRPLADRVAAFEVVNRQVGVQRDNCAALAPLRPPPELADAAALEDHVLMLRGWSANAGSTRVRCDLMEALAEPPVLREEGPLARLCGRLAEGHERCRRGLDAGAALAGIRQPPELRPTAALEGSVRTMARAATAVQDARSRAERLSQVREPPEMADCAPLDRLIGVRAAADAEVARFGRAVEKLDAQLAEVVGQVREWSAMNPTCPVCGAATDAERILAGGHAHG